jgi:hypothetical protein
LRSLVHHRHYFNRNKTSKWCSRKTFSLKN